MASVHLVKEGVDGVREFEGRLKLANLLEHGNGDVEVFCDTSAIEEHDSEVEDAAGRPDPVPDGPPLDGHILVDGDPRATSIVHQPQVEEADLQVLRSEVALHHCLLVVDCGLGKVDFRAHAKLARVGHEKLPLAAPVLSGLQVPLERLSLVSVNLEARLVSSNRVNSSELELGGNGTLEKVRKLQLLKAKKRKKERKGKERKGKEKKGKEREKKERKRKREKKKKKKEKRRKEKEKEIYLVC